MSPKDSYGNEYHYNADGSTAPGAGPSTKAEAAGGGGNGPGDYWTPGGWASLDKDVEKMAQGYVTDPTTARGQSAGRVQGEKLYGQTQQETGANVQDIIKRRREALSTSGPDATMLRRLRNQQVEQAKAQGASAPVLSQIQRNTASDIANTEYARQQGSLGQYQKLIGNVLSGQSQMEMGYAGLEKGGEYQPPPAMSQGLFGTVICTELYRQGILPKDIWLKDGAYGVSVRSRNPYVYYGYTFIASPIVRQMKKSRFFTKLVSIPALAWARNMAGDKNLVGATISLLGEPLCGIVGRLLFWYEIGKHEPWEC